MKKLWLLLLMVTPLQLVHAQEVHHAPTAEQCHADGKLWLSKLGEPNNAGIANVSYSELNAWAVEMNDCMNVDRKFAVKYYNTAVEAMSAQLIREGDSSPATHQWSQFIAEDAQGQGR